MQHLVTDHGRGVGNTRIETWERNGDATTGTSKVFLQNPSHNDKEEQELKWLIHVAPSQITLVDSRVAPSQSQ